MPGTPTTKYAIPTLAGADLGQTIDNWSVSAMGVIDPLLAPSDQGTLAARPVSTIPSPSGKSGRTYYATDTGQLFRDTGTAWIEITDQSYRTLLVRQGLLNQRPVATRPFTEEPLTAGATLNTPPSGLSGWSVFHLDPARHLVGGRTPNLSVTGLVATSATAPASNFTFALYPVTPNAAAASPNFDVVVGTVVSGSAAVITAPAAHTYSYAASSDFPFPAAGFYALCVTNSATTADSTFMRVELTVRLI